MQNQTTNSDTIQNLDNIVQVLTQISEQLIYVMEEQVQAIISSSPEKIEQLTEKQSEMQGEYKKHERAFLQELQQRLSGHTDSDGDVSLTDLKKLFPEEKEQIDHWIMKLSLNSKMLQKKNEQLVELLEFALNRNAKLMHSFYSLFNNKNSHYSSNGEKTTVRSGVAINQEV